MISLKEMPKVELHLHLDGSMRINDICNLLKIEEEEARRNMIAPKECKDLNDYLTKFALPEKVLQSRENLSLASYHLALDLIEDGVVYAEVRFAPLKHTLGGLSLEEVVESVLEGFKRVPEIKVNLILCMMRGTSFDENKKIIFLAKKYLNQGVCALDLAGAEGLYKTSDYYLLFSLAKDEGVSFTIHAGEADGCESIKKAIEFGARRIGHGVRLYEDKSLLELVKSRGILLEMCPTSNIQTRVVESYQSHPIRKYFDYGILTSINTDNRTVSNVTLTDEYIHLMNDLSFTLDEIIKMNKYALDSSFMSRDDKARILSKYNEKMELYLESIKKL